MDKEALGAVTLLLAREMLKAQDIVTGISLAKGFGIMTREELIDVCRKAIDLIEEGKV